MLTDMSTKHVSSQFKDQGFCAPAALRDNALDRLEKEYQSLKLQAERILRFVNGSNMSMADYYQQNPDQLIAVAESWCPETLCRFEHIAFNSGWIKQDLIPQLQKLIYQVTGHEVTLFKDKCNLKSPNGGAFTPHQDIPAYLNFGPTYHITAAVFLDEASNINGALNMATNFLEIDDHSNMTVNTPVGQLPSFECYHGGERNGEIIEQVSKHLRWQCLSAKAGDILLFHSYVPHYSEINLSKHRRRAFFFTFNLIEEGQHYERYYRAKLSDYLNPRFHIATPTRHSDEVSV